MIEIGEKCTISLIVVAALVLLINYGHLSIGSVGSIELGFISLPNVRISSIFVPMVSFALLGGLTLCHFRHHINDISVKYSQGYRENPRVVELVRAAVAAATEDDKYGSPYGGITAGLFRKTHDIGRFTNRLGALSNSVSVRPSATEHRMAVISGVIRALSPKLWLAVYAAPVLAIWAALTIAV